MILIDFYYSDVLWRGSPVPMPLRNPLIPLVPGQKNGVKTLVAAGHPKLRFDNKTVLVAGLKDCNVEFLKVQIKYKPLMKLKQPPPNEKDK